MRTITAPPELAALLEAPETAHAARERAYQDKSAARTALYDAERAYEDADKLRDAAGATRRAILRALYHLPDDEPRTEEPEEPYARRESTRRYVTHRARAEAFIRHSYGKSAPRAHAVGWIDGTTTTLYESPRGTNDPAKIAAELDRADDAARAWIATQTAAAYLRGQGIDPDTAPPVAELVTVETNARPRITEWHGARMLWTEPHYALRLNSSRELIAETQPYDALDRATYDAARSGAPATEHTLELGAPADRAQLDADGAATVTYWRRYAADALPALLARAR